MARVFDALCFRGFCVGAPHVPVFNRVATSFAFSPVLLNSSRRRRQSWRIVMCSQSERVIRKLLTLCCLRGYLPLSLCW